MRRGVRWMIVMTRSTPGPRYIPIRTVWSARPRGRVRKRFGGRWTGPCADSLCDAQGEALLELASGEVVGFGEGWRSSGLGLGFPEGKSYDSRFSEFATFDWGFPAGGSLGLGGRGTVLGLGSCVLCACAWLEFSRESVCV